MRRLIYTYLTMGADEDTSENDLKKIMLLHIFCNTWHLFTVFSFVEDFIKNQLMITSYLIMLFLVTSVQILQYYKRFFVASIIFIASLTGVTLFFSNYIYKAELLEYYFLLPPAISLMYIDKRSITIPIFIVCLLALYIPNLFFDHYPLSVFNNMNPPFLFFSIYIVVSYFKNLNIKNEKILESKTKELEDLDKFKSQFFTNISHEIRTPLTLINGHISELDQAAPNLVEIQKNVKDQINSITGMVDNVLDLAKMQSSNFHLQTKAANVSELIHRQYLSFEPLFKQENISFYISKSDADYIAYIDTVFFERVMNNLIVNALKYTDSGEVRIQISQQKQDLHIAISDTGIGISKDDLSSVFNRFYQVNNDINKSGGSGVGLAFSKEIIELHGGVLLLESEWNRGSTFTIVLPLNKVVPARMHRYNDTSLTGSRVETGQANKRTAKSHFLIVEDHHDMREYLVSILKKHRCFEASNGLEALEILEKENIDFIITDYMMPKLNGHEFVTKLKKSNISIPVIMLTAKTDEESKLEVLRLGIDDYITKPFEKEELLVRIENCMTNNNNRKKYNDEVNSTSQESVDDFIVDLKAYVYEKSSDTSLTQEVIAESFNISKSSFYRKVKSETGLSPNEFIKEIRLQKAREILEKNPSKLLKQIALEVGFRHHTYFSKLYTSRFGSKPFGKIS